MRIVRWRWLLCIGVRPGTSIRRSGSYGAVRVRVSAFVRVSDLGLRISESWRWQCRAKVDKLPPMAAYALTIFIGAFLLFQVQPLIGKYILPWFGGGPGVWTTCMLFFQVLLLGGYAYAHLTTRWLKPRTQAIVHLVLLLAALALLPITPADSWKPAGGGNPTLQILALLSVCLGLPYFVLSSTGPLLQHWFSRANPGVSPYRLYALSNVGSLLALVSYPFYFETHFTRITQATLWAGGLVAYALCCALCAIRLWKAEGRMQNAEAGASRPCTPSPVPRPPSPAPHRAPVAIAPRLRVRVAPGDDQQALPGRRRGSLPLGGAAGALPAELRDLLRQPALVCAVPLYRRARRRHDRLVLGAVPRERLGALAASGRLLRRAVYLLHGVSWRTLPPQARPPPAHVVLPDDRRGRRTGRSARRRRRAAHLHGLLRVALGTFLVRRCCSWWYVSPTASPPQKRRVSLRPEVLLPRPRPARLVPH